MAVCEKYDTKLEFNEKSGKYRVTCGGAVWTSQGRKPYIILRTVKFRKSIYTYCRLSNASKKETTVCGDKIITKYSGFRNFGKKTGFTLICTAQVLENSVRFSVEAKNETPGEIHAVYFPQPINIESGSGYAVEPIRQGFIMPDGYKKNFISTFALTKYWRKMNTGDWYHNFWGRVCSGSTYCAVCETPYDAEGFSCFGKGGSFLTSVNWRSSLGKLNYRRSVLFSFLENGDYNDVAKAFRSYLKENKALVTLEEKIAKNKNVEYLIGAPVLHHRILTNIQPQSKFYKKNGKNRILYATFDERAEQLKAIKKAGLEKLYIHTDGWGINGYDNMHPYILPPNSDAGGFDGMKRLADACRDIGYCFGLHDQYRDFYYDSKKFNKDFAVERIDGSNPYCDIWDGGAHTWLCASKAPEFVKLTYTQLKEHNIKIGGSYLDVFGVMWGDECFNSAHKLTRRQSIEKRGECFDYLRENGIIASSEEGASLLLGKLDLVHHSPFQVRPQGGGRAVGIPVPLTSLIYHDCIFTPWISNETDTWGIPSGDRARLHCILHAGTPYFSPFSFNGKKDVLLPQKELEKEIQNVKELAAIQARLCKKEVMRHEFTDSTYRRQKAIYSDGTQISVDFENNTYNIKWGNEYE